jgi:hypothetical protein
LISAIESFVLTARTEVTDRILIFGQLSRERIQRRAVLGGLIGEYERAA